MSIMYRKRRPKFSVEELKALVGIMETMSPMLYGSKGSPAVLDASAKEQTWVKICNAVNAVSEVTRNVPEVKKKWSDWASVVRRKSVAMDLESEDQSTTLSSRFISSTERRVLALLLKNDGGPGSSQQSSSSILVKPEVVEDASNACSSSQADDSLNYYDNDDRFTPANVTDSMDSDADDNVAGASSQLNQSHSQPQSSGGSSGVDATGNHLHNSNDKFLNIGAETSLQYGVNSNTSEQPRIVRHSDVLLALKRKKLRIMEERLKVEKERLQVERGILQILKELKNKNGLPNNEIL